MRAVTPVITMAQARQITGGRTPNMPVQYEDAIRSLQACIDLDDAKVWSDKADMLAAWAKLYRSDEAARKAKQLKLHAFRRMREIAEVLRPRKGGGAVGGGKGPTSLLIEHGLSRPAASAAGVLARMPKRTFDSYLNRPKPPSPFVFNREGSNNSESFKIINNHGIREFRAWTRAQDATLLAKGLKADEAERINEMVSEVIEWLDEFEQALPKTVTAS